VLQSGRVTEAGTHEELMERQGHYAELFQLQAAAYLAGRHDARDQMPAH
jgi:ATP-binding cassette, subfamily B, bacterial